MPVYLLDSSIEFPNPNEADPNGLLAVGGDLTADRLILAYKMGIFPWYSEEEPILWFSPDPRLILIPDQYSPSKSLLKLIRSKKFEIKIDSNFQEVIENCATVSRYGQSGTWITKDMINAYIKMHGMGYAHSFEAYYNDTLVGGLYGISLGRAFFGESMFHFEPNASKVAFYYLVQFCLKLNFNLIDSQIPTDHMKNMGGYEISREKFLFLLKESLKEETIVGKWTDKL